ncbi:hypothetical protein KA005_59315, partial [bacterium]|nr:hypothetical protein [bacterium]
IKAEYIKAGSAIIVVLISSIFTIFYNIQQNALKKIEIERNTSIKEYQNELKKIEITKNTIIKEHQNKIQEQQNKLVEMQTLEKFIPHLEGKNESRQQAALVVIWRLANAEVALALRKIYDSPGTRKGGDTIMATATSPSQKRLPLTVVTKADTSTQARVGWAYLGGYSADNSRKLKWQTWYFNFDVTKDKPDDLKDRELSVRKETGALNVREGMPTPVGRFPKVIDVLEPGSKVHIQEVREWHSSGYMWAKISFVKEK